VADTLQDPSGQSLEAASTDLSRVFHRLNNQLGVILANAELLESRLADDTQRARAGQVVGGALEAIAAVQDLRRLVSASSLLPR
jgi:signal transduction histidine kinase